MACSLTVAGVPEEDGGMVGKALNIVAN
eukprot:SAG31_NODE_27469_length_425_cov_1.411043_1_plen_27_part_10